MQCVPLACPGFGTGWIVPGSVSASSATAAVGARQLALCGSRHVRIMPCACLPLSLCVCRQLPYSRCFSGMLPLGRWGQPPAVQVRGFSPRIDVGHVTHHHHHQRFFFSNHPYQLYAVIFSGWAPRFNAQRWGSVCARVQLSTASPGGSSGPFLAVEARLAMGAQLAQHSRRPRGASRIFRGQPASRCPDALPFLLPGGQAFVLEQQQSFPGRGWAGGQFYFSRPSWGPNSRLRRSWTALPESGDLVEAVKAWRGRPCASSSSRRCESSVEAGGRC